LYTDFAEAKAAARASANQFSRCACWEKLNEELGARTVASSAPFFIRMPHLKNAARRFYSLLAVRTPCARVTIDFGDGRKLERTLTGNSTHFR